jgi:glycosyltransferase involved in cell wall biosynthesis
MRAELVHRLMPVVCFSQPHRPPSARFPNSYVCVFGVSFADWHKDMDLPEASQDWGPSTVDLVSQAEALIKAIHTPELDPLFWRSGRVDVESAWYGHVPFAHWIVRALAPRCIVELGSHNGVSYVALCEAVQREGLGTRCFAVDTWTGDEHTGFYEEAVFAELRAYHDSRFGAFSTLVRRTFDDALELVPEGSVDLLHIDGRHGYQDVKHDFEAWRDKMSPRGVILLHDTNVYGNGFGVWRLWSELQREFPVFEFLHAHGLGVVAVGTECPPVIAALAGLSDHPMLGVVRERFAQLGERCVLGAQVNLLGQLAGERSRLHDAILLRLNAAETDLILARSELIAARSGLETARSSLAVTEQAMIRVEREAQAKQVAHARESALQELADTAQTAHGVTSERWAAADLAFDRILQVTSWPAARWLRSVLSWLPAGLRRPIVGGLQRSWRALTPHLDPLRQPLSIARPAPRRTLVVSSTSRAPVVCYIGGEPDTPGMIYRVRHYAAACSAVGAIVTVLRFDEIAAHMTEVDNVDFLVIWRAPWTEALAAFIAKARAGGARIVFDVDDLMIDPALATIRIIDGIRSQRLTEMQVQDHFTRLQRTMLAADLCSASTNELAGHMRRFAKPGFMLPNGFDGATLNASRMAVRRRLAAQPDGLLRLGYASGSRTHQQDFAQVAAVLPRVFSAQPNCRLVLFQSNGVKLVDLSEFPDLAAFADRIEWREMVPLGLLPAELVRFDVNLAPLEPDNVFCEAKSELKYFEAALAGVCTVASPVGPYVQVIRHGSNGFLAATTVEWEATLVQLLSDSELRRQVAETALNDVLWTYGPDRRAQLMRHVLAEWQGGAAATDAFVLELNQRSGRRCASPVLPAGEVVFSVDHLRAAEVTVAVPLYNYVNVLIETLDSVRAQTLPQLDLIIVDDASTDQSLETAVAWARCNAERFNRLVVVRNGENVGVGYTRNAAFSRAETAYVLPLDADNLLRPECCELLLAAMHKVQTAFVYPVVQEFGGRSGLIGDAPYDPSRLIGGNYIEAMALIAKSAWCAAGGYSRLRLGWEDYDFWCALAEMGLHGFAVGGRPLADYRVHEQSMLAQITDTQEVKSRVISFIEKRHPWVTVARPVALTSKRQKD